MANVDYDFANRIVLLFARDEADVVILPYIDMLMAAHIWSSPAKFRDQRPSCGSIIQFGICRH